MNTSNKRRKWERNILMITHGPVDTQERDGVLPVDQTTFSNKMEAKFAMGWMLDDIIEL